MRMGATKMSTGYEMRLLRNVSGVFVASFTKKLIKKLQIN